MYQCVRVCVLWHKRLNKVLNTMRGWIKSASTTAIHRQSIAKLTEE